MHYLRPANLLVQIVACAIGIRVSAATVIADATTRATTTPFKIDPYTPAQISLADVMLLARQGGTVIVDARNPEAFAEGRIAGAVNLPLAIVLTDPTAIDRLPAGANLVVYCDSTGCLTSTRIGRLIRERTGRNVSVYRAGWNEWQLLNLPYEK